MQPSSLCLALFFPLLVLLLLATTAEAKPNPNTAGTSPGDNWYNENQAAFDGFCLSAEQGRVLLNWSDPLYSNPIILSPAHPHNINLLITWVGKIMVEELLGYQAWVYDPANNPNDVYQDIQANLVDAAFSVYMEPSQDGPEYSSYTSGGAVLSAGFHGVQSRAGLYLPQQTVLSNPTLSLELWHSYQGGSQGLGTAATRLFVQDTWDALISNGKHLLLTDQSDPASFVCPPDAVLEAENDNSSLFDAGCVDGIYYPPQCLSNPRQDCALLFMPNTFYDQGLAQNIVRNLNLSLAVAYISNYTDTIYALLGAGRNFLFYSPDVDTVIQTQCPGLIPPGLLLVNQGACFVRVFLPTYDVSCDSLTDNSDRGNYTCDFPYQNLVKLSSPTLPVTAPRVLSLMQSMNIQPSHARDMLTDIADLQQVNGSDYKRAACNWIVNNQDTWAFWIAPPAPCGYGDMGFTSTGCSMDSPSYTIAFYWLHPKGCRAGLSLPDEVDISCGLTTTMSQTSSTVVAALMASCVMVIFLFESVALSRKKGRPMRLLWCKGLSFRPRHMILSMFGSRWLLLLGCGMIMLLGTVIVNGTATDLSAACSMRQALCLLGIVFTGISLLAALIELSRSSRVHLQTVTINLRFVVFTLVVGSLDVLLLVLQNVLGSAVASKTRLVSGFAEVQQYHCSSFVYETAVPLLLVNASWVLYMGVHWLRLSLPLAWGAWRRREGNNGNENSDSLNLINTLQLLLLAPACLVWLVMSVLLMVTMTVPSWYEDNVAVLQAQAIINVVCCGLLLLVIWIPALVFQRRFHKHQRRQNKVHAAPQRRRTGSIDISSTTSRVSQSSMSSDVTVMEMLKDPVVLVCLQSLMETTYDAETVRFLVECQALFRSLSEDKGRNSGQVLATATRIFDVFISPSGDTPINVSGAQVTVVSTRMEELRKLCHLEAATGNHTVGPEIVSLVHRCFHEVMRECYSLLKVNGVPRFLSSSFGERANEILEWMDFFEELSPAEKHAVWLKCGSAIQESLLPSLQEEKAPGLKRLSQSSLTTRQGEPIRIREGSIHNRQRSFSSNASHGLPRTVMRSASSHQLHSERNMSLI